MRHRVKGSKLDRSRSSRKALLIGLVRSLIEHGKIKTTISKAKFIKPFAEKLVTRAREKSLANRRLLIARLGDQKIVAKLIDEVAPKYTNRPGGYTRIQKLGPRKG